MPSRPLQAAELFTAIATLDWWREQPEQMRAPARAVPVVRAEPATLRAMGTWQTWLPLASAICTLAALLLNRNPDPNRCVQLQASKWQALGSGQWKHPCTPHGPAPGLNRL